MGHKIQVPPSPRQSAQTSPQRAAREIHSSGWIIKSQPRAQKRATGLLSPSSARYRLWQFKGKGAARRAERFQVAALTRLRVRRADDGDIPVKFRVDRLSAIIIHIYARALVHAIFVRAQDEARFRVLVFVRERDDEPIKLVGR